ncbi:hypothetical protein HZH66_001963 [Vespula vulgaris]|uniref:Uncharacterized protein n=1 Tax=Vespula vulgaris TaxID=7454 RepID=A0A834KK88_VESVU|nr:hypothetical protein HZH66_001963 [Vespula vulgaris]
MEASTVFHVCGKDSIYVRPAVVSLSPSYSTFHRYSTFSRMQRNATGSRSLLRLSFEWNSKVHGDKGFTYGSLQRDPQRRNFSSTMKGFFLTSNLFISFCLKMPIQDTFGEPWIK